MKNPEKITKKNYNPPERPHPPLITPGDEGDGRIGGAKQKNRHRVTPTMES